MRLPLLTILTSIVALAAGQSSQRCFITNDWGSITPGEPNVLVWDSGSFWDVLLNSGVHTQAELAGVIARNITQNSVVWIPPRDIAKGQPNQVFAVQLWDLGKGTGCVSPSFRFLEVNDEDEDEDNDGQTASLPPGPLVTTAAYLLNLGSITATATVATFQSGGAASDHTVTGSITGTDTSISDTKTGVGITGTDTATTTSTSNPGEDNSSGPNIIAIAIGTAFAVLVIILIVLSVLLFRARRRRARQRTNSLSDPKTTTTTSSPAPSLNELDARDQVAAVEVTGASARHEMQAEDAPQELAAMQAPVELPADEMQPPPRYPGWVGANMSVSSLGEASRRSSWDKGTFVVSPASDGKM